MNDNNEYHNIDAMFADHFNAKEVKLSNKGDFWDQLQSRRKEDNWRAWMFIIPLLGVLGILGSFENPASEEQAEVMAMYQPEIEPNNNDNVASVLISESEEEAIENTRVTKQSIKNPSPSVSQSVKKSATTSAPVEKSFEPVQSTSSVDDIATNVSPVANIVIDNDVERIAKTPMDLKSFDIKEPGLLDENDQYTIGLSTKKVKKPNWSKCDVKAKGNWYVDVYAQGARVLETLESGPDAQPYLAEYDQKFDAANGMMAGAMIGYKFPLGLMISGGAEYQRYQSEYQSVTRVVTTTRIWDPMAYFIIDAEGNRVYVGDSVTTTVVTDREETLANNTTLINLPIHIGFQKEQNDWRFGFDVGAIINILKEYEGVHLLPNGNVIALDKDNFENYMTSKAGVSFSGGVSIGKMVTDNMELYLSPRFRYNDKSIFNDDVELSLKNNFAGLRAGMRYYFD